MRMFKLIRTIQIIPGAFFLISLFYTHCSIAQIYKWTDQQGNTRFSDIQPEQRDSKSIEEVNLSGKEKYNRMNANKKALLERVDNKEITSEVERKTEDYKKVRAHNADEDVSSKIHSNLSNAGTGGSGSNNSGSGVNGSGSNNSNSNSNSNNNSESGSSDSQSTFRGSETLDIKNKTNQEISPSSKLDTNVNSKSLRQAKNCATAQENFDKLTQSNNIIVVENYKLKKLSKTELDNQIKEAKSQMAYFC